MKEKEDMWRLVMRNGNKPLVSIIIPVYNVDRYLSKCLDTVISQTYGKLEIILVDDGSTDNSGEICEKYAQKDGRIVVIHKENGGLSDARNVGIDKAIGEYIAFIDSDDFVSKYYIQEMLDIIITHQADIAICNYKKVSSNYFLRENNYKERITCCYDSEEMLKNWHGKYKHIETMAWNKLYKSKLFLGTGIRYPKGYYNEDVQTTHLVVGKAGKIVITNQVLYYYVQRKDSIMGNVTVKKVEDNIFSQKKRLQFFYKNYYIDAYERLAIKLLKYYVLMYYRMKEKKIKNDISEQYLLLKQDITKYENVRLWEKRFFLVFEKYLRRFIKSKKNNLDNM